MLIQQGKQININDPNLIQNLSQNVELQKQFASQLQDPSFQQQILQNPQQFEKILSDPKTQDFIAKEMKNPETQKLVQQVIQQGGLSNLQNLASNPEIQKKLTQGLAQNVLMGMLDDQQKKMEEEEEKTGKNWFERQIPCLNVDYFKPHFNVTTEIVKQRIIAALDYRLHGRFFEIGTTHDFYGPFWIYTTLIFLLAGAGNLQARFISSEVTYDYSYITTAATIVYLFGSLYPLLIHYMLRTFGIENVTWEKIAYLYGYSAVIFLPLTLVCTIPSSLIQWACMLAAGLMTVLFLIKNLSNEIQEDKKQKIMIILGILQILLILFFKLSFFKSVTPIVSERYSLNAQQQNQPEFDLYQTIFDFMVHGFSSKINSSDQDHNISSMNQNNTHHHSHHQHKVNHSN